MSERTRIRKAISIGLGLALAGAGLLGFVYMFLFSGPVTLLVWAAPITLLAAGVAILWDDVKSS